MDPSTDRYHGPVRPLRLLLLGVLGAVGVAACSSVPSLGVVAGKSPGAVLRLALRDARAQRFMHFSIQTKGGVQQDVVGATGPNVGTAVIDSASGTVRIVVQGSSGYIQSDAIGLEASLGLTSTSAAANASKWISLTPADEPFSQLQDSVSFSSTLDEFTPGGKLVLGATTIAGHTVALIQGTGTAQVGVTSYSVELAVTTSAPVLPIGGAVQITANRKTVTQTAVFSQWGKRVTVSAPTGAVPLVDVVPK